MKSRLIPILVANLFAVSAVLAADGDGKFDLSGSVSVGGRFINDSAANGAKLNEYRDLGSDSAIGNISVQGRGDRYYLNFFGENFGLDDFYGDLKGGQYGVFKYGLYGNNLRHNLSWGPVGGQTFYSGVGTNSLTYATAPLVLPSTDTATWTPFNYQLRREDYGGFFEFTNNSPWYFRADANEVTRKGVRPIGSNQVGLVALVELAAPVDYKTKNWSAEGGYSSKRGMFSLNYLQSEFTNGAQFFNWRNPGVMQGVGSPFTDTTTLPPDNDQKKLSLNGALRQLPLGSTLAGRITYEKNTSNVLVQQTSLDVGSYADPSPANRLIAQISSTGASSAIFNGETKNKTASLSLSSQPMKNLDTRVYWYWYRKDNNSTPMSFTPPATALNNPGTVFASDLFNYRKNNFGIDLGYRITPQTKLSGGFDYIDLDRNRVDFNNTKDKKYYVELKNNSLDFLGARLRYQYLERRSNFLEGNAGTGPADVNFLNRFVARFDASNVNQNQIKLVLDSNPVQFLDLGFEAIYKKNDFKDTVLGRTDDKRQEYYANAVYGDKDVFRVSLFGDVEFIRYDSYHRNISGLSASDAYNPFTTPTASNYNWSAKNKDRNWLLGVGADWPVLERLLLKGSYIWSRTEGTVDFVSQNNFGNPLSIRNFDNTRRQTLNLKGVYNVDKHWSVTGGYAYEKYRLSDIALDGYRYTLPGLFPVTTAAGVVLPQTFFTGAYANPNYTANVFYLMGTYKF